MSDSLVYRFKVGDRVRYTGIFSCLDRGYIGRVGRVVELRTGINNDKRYRVVGDLDLALVYEQNLVSADPASPFEESLIAYIAAEKKELGLE